MSFILNDFIVLNGDTMILLLGYGVSNRGIGRFLDSINERYIIRNPSDIVSPEKYTYIVKSPGISLNDPVFELLEGKVISDLELYGIYSKNYTIVVSGTNGKTTISAMIKEMLGEEAVLCGNIGYSIGDAMVDYKNKKYFVIEASSFMLEAIDKFRPDIYVLSNISIAHTDHHGSLKNYINSKLKVLDNMDSNDSFVYLKDIKYIKNCSIKPRLISFSMNRTALITKIGDYIYYKDKRLMNVRGRRDYDVLNMMASLGVIVNINYDLKKAIKRLKKYKGMPFRGEMENKYIINDAKSTNPDATNTLLKEYNHIHLICGGYDRGIPIFLDSDVLKKIKCVYAYGDSKDIINNYFYKRNIRVFKFDNLNDAYIGAFYNRDKRDYIIYSPMYPSYDQYNSFMERGNEFHRITKELIKK